MNRVRKIARAARDLKPARDRAKAKQRAEREANKRKARARG